MYRRTLYGDCVILQKEVECGTLSAFINIRVHELEYNAPDESESLGIAFSVSGLPNTTERRGICTTFAFG